MRTRFCLMLTVLCTILCSACSSPHYKITLKDGREYMAANQPEFNKKTGYYKFRNLSDKDSLLRADEILMMAEL